MADIVQWGMLFCNITFLYYIKLRLGPGYIHVIICIVLLNVLVLVFTSMSTHISMSWIHKNWQYNVNERQHNKSCICIFDVVYYLYKYDKSSKVSKRK